MKKIFALLIAVTAILSFSSCKEKKEVKIGGTDISYYADSGEIPECDYKLGTESEKIKKDLEKESSEPEESNYEIMEGPEETRIFAGNTHYIYNNSTGKVCEILCFEKAYGFELGTDKETVINAENEYGLTGNEASLSEEEARKFSGTDQCVYLEYEFDKNTVIFAFENNCLFATAIKVNVK